jgi:hypothetical protein
MKFLVEGVSKALEPDAQVRRIGEYETVEEAIAAAQQVVDEFLRQKFRPGIDAMSLFRLYQAQGEYPFIFRTDDRTINVRGFSYAFYAMERATKMCGGAK